MAIAPKKELLADPKVYKMDELSFLIVEHVVWLDVTVAYLT